jgi:hypothetical protein
MGRINDPYMDDPYFRDALILNRSGRYTDRPKVDWPSQAKTFKWSVLTVVLLSPLDHIIDGASDHIQARNDFVRERMVVAALCPFLLKCEL